MPEISRAAVDVWIRRFRRIYATNTAGLATLADTAAADAAEYVTFTSTSEDGSSAAGVITGNRLEILAAAEELLGDALFMAGISQPRSRMIAPDFSRSWPT